MTQPEFEAIILDTETTSAEPPVEVIELAWKPWAIDGSANARHGRMRRFKPTGAIQWGAMATHHILPSDLEGFAPSSIAGTEVPAAKYWIGHNVDFDWKALGSPPGVKRICTLAMTRAIWPRLDSHKLGALMYFLEGAGDWTRTQLANAHTASADVMFCQAILNHIVAGYKPPASSMPSAALASLEDLWEFSEDCRLPRVMGFGKYKGQPIGEVDRGWANWYARQEDTDPYLIEALRRARKL